MQAVTTIGFDIAKSVFQVHGVDAAVLHCNDLANIETERSWTAFPNLLGEEESWALLEAWCCRRRRLCYSISVVDVTAVHFTANSNTTRDGTTSVRTAQGRMS